jgi:uncharacterized membrane protein
LVNHPIAYGDSVVECWDWPLSMESHSRSIAKAFSYRILGSMTTGALFFFYSGQLALSVGAGALDMVLKIGLYFVHERVWNHIHFGRPKPPEYEI